MKTLFQIYLAISFLMALLGAIDFARKDSRFSLTWTIGTFVYCFIAWPYGVFKSIQKWKKKE